MSRTRETVRLANRNSKCPGGRCFLQSIRLIRVKREQADTFLNEPVLARFQTELLSFLYEIIWEILRFLLFE